MFIPFISNRWDSTKKMEAGGADGKRGAGGKHRGRGSRHCLSDGTKAPARTSGSSSPFFTTNLPSPDRSILYHILDDPHLPSQTHKASNATFTSETTDVDIDIQCRISHANGAIERVDSLKCVFTLRHVADPSRRVPSLLPIGHGLVATDLGPRSHTIEEASEFPLSGRRHMSSSAMPCPTLFGGDPSTSNSSSTTLDQDRYEDARSSPFTLPSSSTIRPHTPLREPAPRIMHHNDVGDPHLVAFTGEAIERAGNRRGSETSYRTTNSRGFKEEAAAAWSSVKPARSKSLDSMFEFGAWEKGDGEAPTLTMASTTAEQNPSTNASSQINRRSILYERGLAHDSGTSMAEGLQGHGRRTSAKRNSSKLQNWWRKLKGKLSNQQGGHSAVAARRLRLSWSVRRKTQARDSPSQMSSRPDGV